MQSPATLSLAVEQKHSALTQVLSIGLFALLTGVGAQIEIPHLPVPYTLQTFFVLLAGAFLGKRNGAASQVLYLAMGAIGLPVFSSFGFGVVRLVGPTGGYLLGFPVAAFVVGYILDGRLNFGRTLIALCTGLFVIFSLGTLQLNLLYYHDLPNAVVNGFLIFSWWDVLKLAAATIIVQQLARKVNLRGR